MGMGLGMKLPFPDSQMWADFSSEQPEVEV